MEGPIADNAAIVFSGGFYDSLAAGKDVEFSFKQGALALKLDAKYPTLTEDEIKTLVVDDKWLATIASAVRSELDRASQTLTGLIR